MNKQTNDIILKNDNNIFYPENILVKANQLITGKYKINPMEQKVFNYALTKVKYDEKEQRAIAVIDDKELKEFLAIEHRSFSSQLDSTALSLQSNTFLLRDVDSDDFLSIVLIPVAEHTNGKLKLYYEPKCTKFILNLKSNFTKINLDVYKNLQTIYAMRLYEIFKSQIYRAESFVFNYNILDLKFDIGMIETNSKVNNAICRKGMSITEIVENNYISEDSILYKDTYTFTKVINNAIKEINDVTDIWVDCDFIKKGRGGKLTGVKFIVTDKSKIKTIDVDINPIEPTEDELLEMMLELKSKIKSKFTVNEYKQLLECSAYDTSKVLNNYNLSQERDNIKDLYGWLLTAIKGNYYDMKKERDERITVEKGRADKNNNAAKSKNKFNDFSQRKYTDEQIAELEKVLLTK